MGHVLIEGDNLYKILHMSDMLSVDQLPAFLKMYNLDIPVQYLRLQTQLATLLKGDSFLGIFSQQEVIKVSLYVYYLWKDLQLELFC